MLEKKKKEEKKRPKRPRVHTWAEPAAVRALHRGTADVSHPITPCPFSANDEEQGQHGAELLCLSSHENEAGTMRGNNT